MSKKPKNTQASTQDLAGNQTPPQEPSAPAGNVCLLEHNRESLRLWFEQQGLQPYRADQVLKWVYQKGVSDVEKMTDLSKDLRETLRDRLQVYSAKIARKTQAVDGTIKLLLEFPESTTPDTQSATPVQVECVMIPQDDRRTACLSTQAGCPVGCVFCASGLHGLQRSLRPSEIIEQLLRLQDAVGWQNRMTHVVIMGMGEPLANFAATIDTIYTINEKWAFGLGARHITVSTIGIPDRIRELADHNLQLNLAISLHAPTDALRRELVPWAAHIKIAQIFKAAQYYFDITGREITLEYVMLEDVNDHMTQAQQLAKLARKLRCTINLIPYNPVEGLPYKRPSTEKVFAFQEVLRKAGIRTKVRKSRGAEGDAACGQLRQRAMHEPSS